MTTLSDVAVREHLEQMLPLQEAGDHTRIRLTETKREARADGLNIDAINALLPLLSKYPHDKAATVLAEVLRYAEVYGSELPVARSDRSMPFTADPVSAGEGAIKADADAGSNWAQHPLPGKVSSRAPGRRWTDVVALRLPAQIATGALVAFGLVWLLN